MTESTFPFEPVDEPAPEAGGSGRKTALVAGAGALAVAVLGYFVVVPMLSGGASETTTVAIVKHKTPARSKTATKAKPAAKTAAKAPLQPTSYADVSARKDPFKPLVTEPVAVAKAPAGVTAPAGTTTGTTGTGTTGTTAGGSSTAVGGQRVALMTVFTKDGKQFAQTKVGEVVYSPTVGQDFAVSYRLLAVSGKTATYLFGDEQFTLSVGQEVLK